MPGFGKGVKAKQWARFALKLGLFLTDAKLWQTVNEQLKERASDMSETVKRSYEETSDRVGNARDALQGRSHWLANTTTLLGGVGIGIGIGMLLAPVSGERARSVIRDKAADVKSKVGDFASGATRYRPSSVPSTGTSGD